MSSFVGSNGALIEVTDRADLQPVRTMEAPKPVQVEVDRICAWCDKHLGRKKVGMLVPGEDIPQVTHGICDDCLDKQKQEILQGMPPASAS